MDDEEFLRALAEKLRAIRRRQLASQTAMEAATGVAQETISKVLHARRRRRSEQLDRLDAYTNMLLSPETMPGNVSRAVREFLAFGTEEELVASIEHCTALVARRPLQ